jgi:hypothetical protein
MGMGLWFCKRQKFTLLGKEPHNKSFHLTAQAQLLLEVGFANNVVVGYCVSRRQRLGGR